MKRIVVLFLLLSGFLYGLPEGAYQTSGFGYYSPGENYPPEWVEAPIMRIVYLDDTFTMVSDTDRDGDFSDEEVISVETYDYQGMVMCRLGTMSFAISFSDDVGEYIYIIANLEKYGEALMGEVYLLQRAK